MILLVLLTGCGGPPGGVLFYVEGRGAEARTIGIQTPGVTPRRLAQVPGANTPADPDPRGADGLVVAVDESAGHDVVSLWLLPIDGAPAVDLGLRASALGRAAWVPDGSFLVVDASVDGARGLYRIDRTGTRTRVGGLSGAEPAIAPDGQSFVFVSDHEGDVELYRAAIDGSGLTRLTVQPGADTSPSFRADGRLAWLAERGGTPRVWTMAGDGSDPRPLRAGDAADVAFAWSPDGARVAVVSRAPTGGFGLAVLDAAGGSVLDLGSTADDTAPAWAPDSAWIAFTSTRDGDEEIYLASMAGAVRRVTHRAGPDWGPRWVGRPAGKSAWDDLQPPPLPAPRLPATPGS